jgi:hypothetical protein
LNKEVFERRNHDVEKREGSWLDFFTFLSLSPINAILPLPLSRLLLIKMNRRERKSKHKKGDDL